MSSTAVCVLAAYKKYSKDSIALNRLNMTVEKGTIYGLLGPSGCGKTTLLSCIVGEKSLNSGTISIDCNKRSLLGYMPQALSLYNLLTVKETLRYYGQLGGLTVAEIKERTRKLVLLLSLSNCIEVLERLSGGQQRRVSLAVALLTNPDILLLDEPTVGLDSVLARSIWEHLRILSNTEKKTIILTTHYIEETRQADKVGFMRKGFILYEDSPHNIMRDLNCESMEQAFLQLCVHQENHSGSNGFKADQNILEGQKEHAINYLEKLPLFSANCFKAEVFKNAIFIWRNKVMLYFLFVLPALLCVCFNYSLGTEPTGITVGIVNDELINGIESCYESTEEGCNLNNPLSCRIIKKLTENNINLKEFPSVAEANKYIKKLHLWGIISIPQNYSHYLLQRLEFNWRTDNESIERGQINVWYDLSDYYVGTFLKIKSYKGFMEALQSYFHDCGWPLKTFDIPIKMEESLHGNIIPNMTHYFGPPVIILLVFFFPLTYTIAVLLQEKIDGVLDRSMTLGLQLTEVFLGHAVVQIIILVIQIAISVAIVFVGYGHPLVGNIYSLAALALLQGICGMSFGFFLSLLCTNIFVGTLLSFGTVFSYILLSGFLWPVEGMHFSLRWCQPFVPLKYPIDALRAIATRGWPISHPTVYIGFISVLVWSILYVVLAFVVNKFKIQIKVYEKKKIH